MSADGFVKIRDNRLTDNGLGTSEFEKFAYQLGFTDPLVEAMERALEDIYAWISSKDGPSVPDSKYNLIVNCETTLEAYRAAKAKVKESGK